MNTKILKSKMILFGDNGERLSRALKISPSRLSAKMNSWNGAEFTQSEIEAIKSRYQLTPEEVVSIFLN